MLTTTLLLSNLPAMDADLAKLLRATRLSSSNVRSLATRLPASEEELDRLIESLVASADETAVTALMLAMLSSGRTIKSRLLPGVLPLMKDLEGISAVALHGHEDVPEVLVAMVEGGALSWERQAVLLLIAGWICRNRETDLPPTLIPQARMLARDVGERAESLLPLFALAQITEDKGLRAVLEEKIVPPPAAAVRAAIEFLIEKPIDDPLGHLPEQVDRVISGSGPLRRAVAKVGRNDPCPCGSGKKYKKCCFEKDQERLHHSSEVAGVTTDELQVMPEPFLTRYKLEALRGPQLARLRIELVPPPLQKLLLARLSLFNLHDALVAAWEKIGWRDDLKVVYENCLFEAAHAGNRETLIRLMALRGITDEHESLAITGKLLLARDNPERCLSLIEEAARKHLEDEKDLGYVDLACALTESNLPGLGTLVARGAAAVAAPYDVDLLFEHIGKVRDRLNLSPEDPADWMLDRLFDLPDELDEQTREDLAMARRQMDAATAEATRLRTQLAETRAQLERQDRLAARNKSTVSTPASSATSPEPSAGELRKRIDELKSALKERHTERNTLRRELNEALKETAALRESKTPAGSGNSSASEFDREDQALLTEETTALQPLRLPVFPSHFSQTLAGLPEHVGRSVMTLIGRLAAGEPAAFVGMRRLRLRHEICRVRVARDYRLLFKLQTGKLEIVDFINRRDFEKWLKLLN